MSPDDRRHYMRRFLPPDRKPIPPIPWQYVFCSVLVGTIGLGVLVWALWPMF